MKAVVVGLVLAAMGLAGCSNEIQGTPMADPAATAAQAPTRTPRTIQIPIPSFPNLPIPGLPGPTTGGPPPTGLAATTCGDYLALSPDKQRQVIDAIGKDNALVQMNPELWVGLASAMCSFTPKTTLVQDAVAGQGFR